MSSTTARHKLGESILDRVDDAEFGERADGKVFCDQCNVLVSKRCASPLCKGPTPAPTLSVVDNTPLLYRLPDEGELEQIAINAAHIAIRRAMSANVSLKDFVRRVVDKAGELTNLNPRDIAGGRGFAPLSLARTAVILAVRRRRRISFTDLGEMLGRNESTIRGLHLKAERLEKRDPEFAELVARLEAVL